MDTRDTKVGRQRILDVAEGLFTERGYRAVSIRDIAHHCSVTNAALYYHFPSKAAMFDQVMERFAERLTSLLQEAGNFPGTYRQRIEAMLLEYTRIAADHHSPFFLLRRDKGDLSNENEHVHKKKMILALLKPLEEVIRSAIEGGELRRFPEEFSPAALLIGMLHGQIQYRRAYQSKNIDTGDVHFIVDLFWEGVKA